MTITLHLDPEKEARLRYQAALRGQDVADYLLSLADANAPLTATETYPRKPPPQGSPEWKAALRNMAIINDPEAVLSIEATSRESIYEDDPR